MKKKINYLLNLSINYYLLFNLVKSILFNSLAFKFTKKNIIVIIIINIY